MQRSLLLGVVGLGLFGISCTGAAPPLPPVTEASVIADVAQYTSDGATLLAGFRMAIDPDTLAATVTPHRAASAQPPQGQRYDLDIANFQNADSFRVTGVQVLGSGNFRISFSHAHPFPAPNVDLPATGTNRADLGYTGRLLLLTSYNPKSYFSGAVRLSAGAVVAPDGYVETGDLLAHVGPSLVTAYPYKLLADEALDNREGMSNGNLPAGNYSPASGGWSRGNIGFGDGWTGYDYIHGGQTVTNTFTLDKDALATANFALDVALLIQYTDPRGAGGATHRLPAATPNVLNFAYRLPYAALDVSKAAFTQNLALTTTLQNATTLEVRLRDWDAGADEAGDSTVGDEGDVTLVQAGGAGVPEVVLDAPGILTGLRNLGTPTGTGQSNSPLLYSNQVVNQAGATPGEYFMCLRITDPEFTDTNRGSYQAGVDPTTLIPSASRAVPARTWQLVPVTVVAALEPPVISAISPAGTIGAVDEFVSFEVTASNAPTSYSIDVPAGGLGSGAWNGNRYTAQLSPVAGLYTVEFLATNAAGDSTPFPFEFRVLPPRTPRFVRSELNFSNLQLPFPEDNLAMLINGLPAVFRTVANGQVTAADLIVSQALIPNPAGTGDWEEYIISSGVIGALSVAEVANRPAIATGSTTSDEVGLYFYATTATPLDAGDWVRTEYKTPMAGQDFGRVSSLVERDGKPAILTREEMSDDLYLFQATTATPANPASWAQLMLAPGMEAFDLAVVEFLEGERLVASLLDRDISQLYVYKAKIAQPIDPSDFLISGAVVNADPGFAISSLGMDHTQPVQLAVVMSTDVAGVRYYAYKGQTAIELAAVRNYSVPATGGNLFPQYNIDLIRHNGRFAVIHPDITTGEFVVMRALTADPVSSDWARVALDTWQLYGRQGLLSYNHQLMAITDEGPAGGWGTHIADGPW